GGVVDRTADAVATDIVAVCIEIRIALRIELRPRIDRVVVAGGAAGECGSKKRNCYDTKHIGPPENGSHFPCVSLHDGGTANPRLDQPSSLSKLVSSRNLKMRSEREFYSKIPLKY